MKLLRLAGVLAVSIAGAMSSLAAVAPRSFVTPTQVTPVAQSPQGRGQTNRPPPPPLVTTGLIVGRVVDAATGKPVSGAIVQLSGGPARPAPPPQAPGAARGNPMPPPQPPRILTDAEGRFAFRNLTRGNYSIGATRTGYAPGGYGRSRADGPTRLLQLDDNERMNDVVIRVFKYASITGRLTDEAGEPIVGAQLRAYRRVLVAGRRRFQGYNSAQTDDRGVYRFGNLTPGEYVVSAPMSSTAAPVERPTAPGAPQTYSMSVNMVTSSPPGLGGGGRQLSADGRFVVQSDHLAAAPDASGRWRGYATQYYPASRTIAGATSFALASGEERTSVDIQMRYVPVSNISGVVTAPSGPAANFVLRLMATDTGELTSEPETATTATDGSGAFTFIGIPSGQYSIQAVVMPRQGTEFVQFGREEGGAYAVGPAGVPQPPPQPLLWATAPATVGDSDVAGVSLTLREGFSVSGRFEFTGTRPRPDPQRLTQLPVVVEPADGRNDAPQSGPPSRVNPDGRFVTAPRLPGKYLLRIGGAPAGFIVQSIMVNGVNATDAPFDLTDDATSAVITFTDQIATVSGTVSGVEPAHDPPSVVIFPADSRAWKDYGINPLRMRSTRVSPTGAFSFGTLVAGDYFAAAIRDEFSSEWQDPAYLEVLSRSAERFTLGQGQKHTLALEISNAKPPGIGREPDFNRGDASSMEPADSESALPQDDAPDRLDGGSRGPAWSGFGSGQTPARDTRAAEPTGTGSISGTVMVDDGSPRPGRLARVRVTGGGLIGERSALTDDSGRYTIAWLPAGDYQVIVTKPAYLQMYYGGKRPALGPGTSVHVGTGQAVGDINVTLPKGAVIAGTVFDELGQPAPGVRIQILTFTRRDGERVLTGAAGSGGQAASSTTNDRGEFRVYGLRPGAWVLMATPQSLVGSGQDLRQLSDADMRAAIAEAARAPTPPSVFDTPRTIAPAPTPDVPVSPPGGRSVSFSPLFYPGTVREAEAAELTVTAGQELNGINFPLALVPASRLEGRIIGPDGQIAAGAQVQLGRAIGSGFSTFSVRQQDGNFQALGVAAGHYTLMAQWDQPRPPGSPGAAQAPLPASWAQLDLDLNGEDRLGLVLTLAPLPTITGRVAFEGGPPPEMKAVQVRVESAGSLQSMMRSTQPATPDADGTFTLRNVVPGKYRLNASVSGWAPSQPGAAPAVPPSPGATTQATPGWAMLSATAGGQDAFVSPFEVRADRSTPEAVVTLTRQPAEISGKLLDRDNRPAPGLTVVLFPADRALWPANSSRVNRISRPNTASEFSFSAVVPGDYYLAVLTELDSNDWADPDFKGQLVASSIKVSVAKGEKKVQDIRVK